MQTTMSHQKSIDSAIKNLEVQVSQLAKQMVERTIGTFGANTEKNPKEKCKVIFTRGENTEKEKRIEEDVSDEEGEKKKKEEEEKGKNESKESSDEVSTNKIKSQLAWDARKEIP